MHARTRTHHAHDAAPAQAAVLRHPAEEREPEGAADALERVDGYLPNPPHPALRSAQAVSRTLEHAWRAPRRRPACREGRELEQGGEDSEDVGHGHACVSEARHALVAWMPLGGVTGSGVSPPMTHLGQPQEGVVVLCLDIKSAFHELRRSLMALRRLAAGLCLAAVLGWAAGERPATSVDDFFYVGRCAAAPVASPARSRADCLPRPSAERAHLECGVSQAGRGGWASAGRRGLRPMRLAPRACVQCRRSLTGRPPVCSCEEFGERCIITRKDNAMPMAPMPAYEPRCASAGVSPVAVCAACLAWLTLRQPFARGVQPSAPS